jgi:hypothetical protein
MSRYLIVAVVALIVLCGCGVPIVPKHHWEPNPLGRFNEAYYCNSNDFADGYVQSNDGGWHWLAVSGLNGTIIHEGFLTKQAAENDVERMVSQGHGPHPCP